MTGGKSLVFKTENQWGDNPSGKSKSHDPRCQEKLLTRKVTPVLKPTQVGRKRILRCARKPSLRNSANCIRNLGIRMTAAGEGHATGAGSSGTGEAQATV